MITVNTRFIRILACVLLVSVALFAFASCEESAEDTTSTTSAVQSEESNPFGDSFSPTNPGDTSLGNAASGLQEPPKYDPTVTC